MEKPSAEAAQPEGNDLVRPVGPPKRVEEIQSTVPEKYQNAHTSGLEFTVKKGHNRFDVDLTP